METVLRTIRTDLRLSMNGSAAASMRRMGIKYRMIFGVDILRLQEISYKYKQNKELAEKLWNEDVRELKIMATMLFPPGEMAMETTSRWVKQIGDQELREQACKNLFEKLLFANELVEEWSGCADEGVRTTGYWLFARLCISRPKDADKTDPEIVLKRAVRDLNAPSLLLYQSALNALRFYGRTAVSRAAWVLQQIASFELSVHPREQEMYDQLKYEFDNSVD